MLRRSIPLVLSVTLVAPIPSSTQPFATSDPLARLTPRPFDDNPVFSGTASWNTSTKDPFLLRHDSVYHLFYSAIPGPGPLGTGRWSIGHATSTDLIHWHDEGQVLTGSTDWDVHVFDPWIVREGRGYVMYYSAATTMQEPYLPQATGRARSADLGGWSAEPDPILRADGYTLWGPAIVHAGGRWLNFYSAFYAAPTLVPANRWRIQLAVSSDGRAWTDLGTPVIRDAWQDRVEAAAPFVWNGRLYMTVTRVPEQDVLLLYRSDDGGETWNLLNPEWLRKDDRWAAFFGSNSVLVEDDRLILAYHGWDHERWRLALATVDFKMSMPAAASSLPPAVDLESHPSLWTEDQCLSCGRGGTGMPRTASSAAAAWRLPLRSTASPFP